MNGPVGLIRTLTGVLSAGALAGTLFLAAPVSALVFDAPAGDAAEFCRMADEEGGLIGPLSGATRGECVNVLMGPASPESSNVIAGFCGVDLFQMITGTTSKGECIKVVRSFEA